MALLSIFDNKGDGSQDDGTLYSLSVEFLEAACLLQVTSPTRVNVSSAIYYLLGHSVELLLKAFLFKRAFPVSHLKKIGHDLEKLVSCAHENGLPETLRLPLILQLDSVYKEKVLEYRTKKGIFLPNVELLTEEIKSLQSAIFEQINDFLSPELRRH